MQCFMAPLLNKQILTLVATSLLMGQAAAQTSVLSQADIMDLLFSQMDQPIEQEPSCQQVGSGDEKYLADVISHYMAVLAESESTQITASSTLKPQAHQIEVTFAVKDPEAPWRYGVSFEVQQGKGVWNVKPDTLTCTGL